MGKEFDVLIVRVQNASPYDLSEAGQASFPSDDQSWCNGVRQGIWDEERQCFVAGSVDFVVNEHPTPAQESWLRDQPGVTSMHLIQE